MLVFSGHLFVHSSGDFLLCFQEPVLCCPQEGLPRSSSRWILAKNFSKLFKFSVHSNLRHARDSNSLTFTSQFTNMHFNYFCKSIGQVLYWIYRQFSIRSCVVVSLVTQVIKVSGIIHSKSKTCLLLFSGLVYFHYDVCAYKQILSI